MVYLQSFLVFGAANLSIILSKNWYNLHVSTSKASDLHECYVSNFVTCISTIMSMEMFSTFIGRINMKHM